METLTVKEIDHILAALRGGKPIPVGNQRGQILAKLEAMRREQLKAIDARLLEGQRFCPDCGQYYVTDYLPCRGCEWERVKPVAPCNDG